MIYHRVCSSVLEKNVYSAKLDEMFCSFLLVFGVSQVLCFLTHLLIVLCVIESGVFKSILVILSISIFNSVKIYFIYLEALRLVHKYL